MLLSAGLQTGIPLGSFATDVPKAGFGANFQIGLRSVAYPLEVLGSLDFLLYGYQSSRRTSGYGQPHGFELEVDRFQYMIPLHLHLRYSPEFGKISPFAEVYGGMRLIASRTRAIGNVLISSPDNPEAFSTRLDYYDFTSSYGLGAGLSYQLSAIGNVRYKCSLYGRWMRGGKANYLSTDDIKLNGNALIYEARFNETFAPITARIYSVVLRNRLNFSSYKYAEYTHQRSKKTNILEIQQLACFIFGNYQAGNNRGRGGA